MSVKQLKPVVFIQHSRHEPGGTLERALRVAQIPTRFVHTYRNDPFPDADEISGLVSLGGPMGANDEQDHPWILSECKLHEKALKKGIPVIGICLGAQILARSLGAKVERNTRPEIGWHPIDPTSESSSSLLTTPFGLAPKSKPTVYHWHYDTFHLPKGGLLLAKSEHCERQAFQLDEKTYGLQFHPEVDQRLLEHWLSFTSVDKEIERERKKYGTISVQSVQEQKREALNGEASSVSIIAALSTLFFQGTPRKESPCDFEESAIQNWIASKATAEIKVPGHPRALKGHWIASLQSGEHCYGIFRDKKNSLWPIRSDIVTSIKKALK